MAVEGYGGRRLQELAVESREDAYDVVGTGTGLNDTRAEEGLVPGILEEEGGHRADILLIDSFHKLPNHQGNTLNPLDFLLGANKLALQAPAENHDVSPSSPSSRSQPFRASVAIPLLILNVFLLQFDVLQLPLKLL